MKNASNKYFAKGKRTQQAIRAIARNSEKAVQLIGRGNNALSRLESRILQAAKTATHNPRVKISRAVRQTTNALLDNPRLKMLKPIAEKIRNASAEIRAKKQGYKINQPLIDALEFDSSVLGLTNFLERHKVISPRQANKIRIAQRETTVSAPRKRDGIIPLDQKQREEVLNRALYISRDIAGRKNQTSNRQERKLFRLRSEVDSKTKNNPLYDTSKKLQQALDNSNPATQIKTMNRQKKVQQAYDTLGENYYNVRSALLRAQKLLSALKMVRPLRVKSK